VLTEKPPKAKTLPQGGLPAAPLATSRSFPGHPRTLCGSLFFRPLQQGGFEAPAVPPRSRAPHRAPQTLGSNPQYLHLPRTHLHGPRKDGEGDFHGNGARPLSLSKAKGLYIYFFFHSHQALFLAPAGPTQEEACDPLPSSLQNIFGAFIYLFMGEKCKDRSLGRR